MSSDCVKSIFTPRLARQHQLNEFLTMPIRQLTVVRRRGGRQVDPTQKDAVGNAAQASTCKDVPSPVPKTPALFLGPLTNTPLKGGAFSL